MCKAKCFSVMALLLVCSFVPILAASDSSVSHYSDAVINYTRVIAQQGPFNYIKNVSLASTDFVVPTGVTVQLVTNAHAGDLKVATWTDTATLYQGSNDIAWVNARRIFKTGTTADSIVVWGKR
jgi:hypothetical protein